MCVRYVGTKCKSLKVALSASKRTNQRNILHYTKKTQNKTQRVQWRLLLKGLKAASKASKRNFTQRSAPPLIKFEGKRWATLV